MRDGLRQTPRSLGSAGWGAIWARARVDRLIKGIGDPRRRPCTLREGCSQRARLEALGVFPNGSGYCIGRGPSARTTSGNLIGKIAFPVAAAATLLPFVSPGAALLMGMLLALTVGNPYAVESSRFVSPLLQLSVIGLGAGMNLAVVGRVGAHGFVYTVVGITVTMTVGLLLGRLIRTGRDTSLLLCVGTAICGGSAIAAVAPTIRRRATTSRLRWPRCSFSTRWRCFFFPGLAIGWASTKPSSAYGARWRFTTPVRWSARRCNTARAPWRLPPPSANPGAVDRSHDHRRRQPVEEQPRRR